MASPIELDDSVFEQEKERLEAWLKQLKELHQGLKDFSANDVDTSLSLRQYFRVVEAGGLIAVKPSAGLALVGVDLVEKRGRPNDDRYTNTSPFLGATYLKAVIHNRRKPDSPEGDINVTILSLSAYSELSESVHGVLIPGNKVPDEIAIGIEPVTAEQILTPQ
jgi:hypothetical protein